MKTEIPFSAVRFGERFEIRSSTRQIAAVKLRQVYATGLSGRGGGPSPRNAAIIEVLDSGTNALGTLIFEPNELLVQVDRP